MNKILRLSTMEEYKRIKGFERYSVSNYGNVKNENTDVILKGLPNQMIMNCVWEVIDNGISVKSKVY